MIYGTTGQGCASVPGGSKKSRRRGSLLALGLLLSLDWLSSANAHALGHGLVSSESYHEGHGAAALREPLRLATFGDSISSGFNSETWVTKVFGGAYSDRVGDLLAQNTGRDVQVNISALVGANLDWILSELSGAQGRTYERAADYVFLNGGGNNFLALNDDGAGDMCTPATYLPIVAQTLADWKKIFADTRVEARAGSQVRALTIYYPRYNETKARRTCHNPKLSPHPCFFPALLKVNYGICQLARAYGYACVDAFAQLNCSPRNRDQCRIKKGETEAAYTARLLDLDSHGKIRDASAAGLLQDDNLHPNSTGTQQLAQALYQSL